MTLLSRAFAIQKSTNTSTPVDVGTTGIGFQPKALILWGGAAVTPGGVYRGYYNFYGFSNVTSNMCVSNHSYDDAAPSSAQKIWRNDYCYHRYSTNVAGQTVALAKIKTFDADGFTTTYDQNTNTADYVHGLAFGGNDITNVYVGSHSAGTTSTGVKEYTGIGFQPDIVFLAWISGINPNETFVDANMGMGYGISPTRQYAHSICSRNNMTPSDTMRVQSTAHAVYTLLSNGTVGEYASFGSMLSDGFSLNWIDPPDAAGRNFVVMAIKGGTWDIGKFYTPSDEGVQNVAINLAGQTPKGILYTSAALLSDSTSVNINNRLVVGASDSNLNQSVYSHADDDDLSVDNAHFISYTDKCVVTSSAPNYYTSRGSIDSVGADQFAINWDYLDYNRRQIAYVAAGNSSPASKSFYVSKGYFRSDK